jgi:hypothetical protein
LGGFRLTGAFSGAILTLPNSGAFRLYFSEIFIIINLLEVAMKKIMCIVVFLTALVFGSPVFAQKIPAEKTSEYFYENVSLEKVYPTKFGYILQYRKGGVDNIGRMYVPVNWFTDAASKAEMITLPPGKNWPSVTIYTKNGEFSHLRLYVHRWRGHQTWGNVPLPINSQLGHLFENVESVKIEYE